ncbi:hypothetical protein [Saccharothrix syringae]|uniref:Uncharacterized protein n=1 Tax=Saccharothrix syringae TaxID=103733 RepID=A0A5Q0H3E0_SACSY|nr:hypothetical protein [Saccharothrix syringae]QFZ20748.1 hypothetical protein EKG83_28105 [Saccharothrix syringae]
MIDPIAPTGMPVKIDQATAHTLEWGLAHAFAVAAQARAQRVALPLGTVEFFGSPRPTGLDPRCRTPDALGP